MGVTHDKWLNWSEANVKLLTTFYDRGYSARLIAVEINAANPHARNLVTRSAVIGKLTRLGLTQANRDKPSPPKRRSPKLHVVTHLTRSAPKARKHSPGNSDGSIIALQAPIWMAARKATYGVVAEVHPDADDLLFARPWTTREKHECKWPFGPADNTLSCCRPVERFGFCAKHVEIGFEPRTKTQQASDKKLMAWLRKVA